MKTLFAVGIAIIIFLATSCKKQDCAPQNFWKVDGVTHEVRSIYGIIPGEYVQLLFARDGDSTTRCSNIDFDFDKLPTQSGEYEVSGAAGPMQIQILATSYFGDDIYRIYSSTGNDHVKAHVTVNEGKITLDMPDVWAKNTSGTDSVKISAHVYQ